ncbi:MAG: hypothetical protein LUG93_17100 [Lachnospiraceae bacterium]|nr:hypothetical protein [Lachnospiraceae bacterium]
MNPMMDISLNTLLLSLKENNSDLHSSAMKELENRYGTENAGIIYDILRGKETGLDLESPVIFAWAGEEEKNKLKAAVAYARETDMMPIDSIMEIYRCEDELLPIIAKELIIQQLSDYIYYLIYYCYPTCTKDYVNDLYCVGICGLLEAMDSYDSKVWSLKLYSRNLVIREIVRYARAFGFGKPSFGGETQNKEGFDAWKESIFR